MFETERILSMGFNKVGRTDELIWRPRTAALLGLLVANLFLGIPMAARADPCEAAPDKGLTVFDTIIGPVKVDRAFLGDPFFGVGAPSMTPTFSLWYPDGAPIDLMSKSRARREPCDEGRRGIISFRLEETSDHAKPFGALATIARVRANLHETGVDFFQGFASADHNLDGPVSGERNYHIMDDLGERIAILSCTAWRGSAAPPRPSCHGLIGFFDRDVVVFVVLPAQLGFDGTSAKWRDVADFIDKQINIWTR